VKTPKSLPLYCFNPYVIPLLRHKKRFYDEFANKAYWYTFYSWNTGHYYDAGYG
jgi:hypothetical protein